MDKALEGGRAIVALCTPAVGAGRVFAVRAEASTPMPYIVYRRAKSSAIDDSALDKDAGSGLSAIVTYEADIFTADYPAGVAIARQIITAARSVCEGATLGGLVVGGCTVIDASESTTEDGDILIQSLDIELIM